MRKKLIRVILLCVFGSLFSPNLQAMEDSNAKLKKYLNYGSFKKLIKKPETLKIILDAKADVDLQNEQGYCLLHFIACAGEMSLFNIVKNYDPDPDLKTEAKWFTPLALAAINKKADLLRHLVIECGADVNALDKKARSVLQLSGSQSISDLLVMLGSTHNGKGSSYRPRKYPKSFKALDFTLERRKHCYLDGMEQPYQSLKHALNIKVYNNKNELVNDHALIELLSQDVYIQTIMYLAEIVLMAEKLLGGVEIPADVFHYLVRMFIADLLVDEKPETLEIRT